jgi:hypothetical protein
LDDRPKRGINVSPWRIYYRPIHSSTALEPAVPWL